MKKELLVVENGSIMNNGTEIIKSLYFSLFYHDSLVFVFDNALDKNVLVEFLKGRNPLQTGKIFFDNRSIAGEDYKKCFEKNISVIERASKLFPSLSVEENIFLLSPQAPPYFIYKNVFEQQVKKLESKFGIDLRKYRFTKSLSEKDRVILEMVKAFAEGKKIIALSNISSFLNEMELMEVYEMIKKMRRFGLSFLVIEAFFDEKIFRWSDHFAIIKHGKTMALLDSEHMRSNRIFELILGSETEKKSQAVPVGDTEIEESTTEVEFRNVCTDVLQDLSFSVGKGEVIKIYYMDDDSGNHILELFRGERKPSSGKILLEGKNYSIGNVNQTIKKGVVLIDEFAYEDQLLPNLTAFENICLLLGEKVPMFWFLKRFRKNIRTFLETVFNPDDLDKRPKEIQPVELLRMLYYKWYLYNPKVVICIRPFAQEDLHIREATISMIDMLKKRGITIIILVSMFSEISLIEGENIFVHNGAIIDEDEVYQFLYGRK